MNSFARYRFCLLVCCVVIAGCDAGRLERLEKENADLRAKVEKQNAALEYDLQEKCSKDARAWFNTNWGARDKDTIFQIFTNHYNKASNTCFIRVEYHYNQPTGIKLLSEWVNHVSLWNVYENDRIGDFSESHEMDLRDSGIKNIDRVITCEVNGAKCTSINQFAEMTNSYLSN